MFGALIALGFALVTIGFLIWKGVLDRKEEKMLEKVRERTEAAATRAPPAPASPDPPERVPVITKQIMEMGQGEINVILQTEDGRVLSVTLLFTVLDPTWIKKGIPTLKEPLLLLDVADAVAKKAVDRLIEALDHPDNSIGKQLTETVLGNLLGDHLRKHGLGECVAVALGTLNWIVGGDDELVRGAGSLPAPKPLDVLRVQALGLAATDRVVIVTPGGTPAIEATNPVPPPSPPPSPVSIKGRTIAVKTIAPMPTRGDGKKS